MFEHVSPSVFLFLFLKYKPIGIPIISIQTINANIIKPVLLDGLTRAAGAAGAAGADGTGAAGADMFLFNIYVYTHFYKYRTHLQKKSLFLIIRISLLLLY